MFGDIITCFIDKYATFTHKLKFLQMNLRSIFIAMLLVAPVGVLQAQSEEGMFASTAVPPQIPQPVQAASVEASPQPQPEMVQAVSSEPVVEPTKA